MHSICEPSVHGRSWKQQAPTSSGHSSMPHAVSSPWKMPPWLVQRAMGRTVQRFCPKQQAPVCALAERDAAKTTAKAARPSIARTPRLACLERSLIVPGIHTTHSTSRYCARPIAGAIGKVRARTPRFLNLYWTPQPEINLLPSPEHAVSRNRPPFGSTGYETSRHSHRAKTRGRIERRAVNLFWHRCRIDFTVL